MTLWFQRLNCEDLLLFFFISYDSNLMFVGFWPFDGHNKHFEDITSGNFPIFWHSLTIHLIR